MRVLENTNNHQDTRTNKEGDNMKTDINADVKDTDIVEISMEIIGIKRLVCKRI